jgi:D-beta-D-heptose 7-phosphate kinase/D-beta-D-heptose 1-phosphate adenosyltransferase
MRALGISSSTVVRDPRRPTTVKTRIIAGGQQLLRVDREQTGDFPLLIRRRLMAQVKKTVGGCHAVIVSDYRKGVVTADLMRQVAAEGRRRAVPIIVDPKRWDFSFYRGADYLTPNLKEAAAASRSDLSSIRALERQGRRLINEFRGRGIVITRGQDGAFVVDSRSAVHIPARAREVFDVTGAGDTFIAYFTLALAVRQSAVQAAELGNAAAGVAVSKLGAVPVSYEEVMDALKGAKGRWTS